MDKPESIYHRKEETINALKVQQLNDYAEEAHEKADSILCNFLNYLGYSDVVIEWKKVPKWYS
jgi:hypothetical protein